MNRTQKILWIGTLALAVILAGSTSNLLAKDDPTTAYHPVITMLEGSVKVMGEKYGVWEPAEVGLLLLSGDVVKTDRGSSAEIQFLSGKVRIYENSMLVVPSIGVQDRKKDIQDIVVDEGDVLFDINPLGLQKHFEFRTKNVQGGVKGTVFMVSYVNDGTTVSVYRGTVWVSGLGEAKAMMKVLKAGQAIRFDTGDEDFNDIREFDPDDSCIQDYQDYTYNAPPGLDDQDRVPSDSNANEDNNGVRTRPEKIKK